MLYCGNPIEISVRNDLGPDTAFQAGPMIFFFWFSWNTRSACGDGRALSAPVATESVGVGAARDCGSPL